MHDNQKGCEGACLACGGIVRRAGVPCCGRATLLATGPVLAQARRIRARHEETDRRARRAAEVAAARDGRWKAYPPPIGAELEEPGT